MRSAVGRRGAAETSTEVESKAAAGSCTGSVWLGLRRACCCCVSITRCHDSLTCGTWFAPHSSVHCTKSKLTTPPRMVLASMCLLVPWPKVRFGVPRARAVAWHVLECAPCACVDVWFSLCPPPSTPPVARRVRRLTIKLQRLEHKRDALTIRIQDSAQQVRCVWFPCLNGLVHAAMRGGGGMADWVCALHLS